MDGSGGEGADVHTALLCECSEIIISLLENCHNSDYFPEKYEGTLNIAHLTYDMVDLWKRCPYILNF